MQFGLKAFQLTGHLGEDGEASEGCAPRPCSAFADAPLRQRVMLLAQGLLQVTLQLGASRLWIARAARAAAGAQAVLDVQGDEWGRLLCSACGFLGRLLRAVYSFAAGGVCGADAAGRASVGARARP